MAVKKKETKNKISTKKQKKTDLRENAAYSEGLDADEYQYRPVTETIHGRDQSPRKQDDMIQLSVCLYNNNGMAHRILEMTKDFVMGDGIRYEATDMDVKAVLDNFWKKNEWDLMQSRYALELGLFGEQLYPAFVNKANGEVMIGYIDPLSIATVHTDSENVKRVTKIELKSGKGYKKIEIDNNPDSKTQGYRVGDAFIFAVNKITTAKRGRSDLLTLVDGIDSYEKFLFNRMEWSRLVNRFLWDVTLEGASNEEIKNFLSKNKTLPKPGSMRVHNEKVNWEAVVPKLEASDASEEAKLFRSHILGQAGFPPPWFGAGEGITRATALEMSTPSYKMLKSRQNYIKYMIREIFEFVIDQAIIYETLDKKVDRRFTLFFPKLVEKDFAEIATAISAFTNSLIAAISEKLISIKSARTILNFLYTQVGMDLESENEELTISNELDENFERFKKDYKEKS